MKLHYKDSSKKILKQFSQNFSSLADGGTKLILP